MDINVAVFGCGKQAEKHIKACRANGIEKIGVYDLNANAAKRLGETLSVDVWDDPEAIWKDSSITFVDICTPTKSHAPLISKALDAGKHYLVEKPFASSLKEAQLLAKKTEEVGVTGGVGFTYRFAPSLVEIKRELEKEDRPLGDVVSSFFRIGGRGSHALWKHRIETNGGAILEMLVHMIDLAVWYHGEMDEIELMGVALHNNKRIIAGVEETVNAEDYVTVKLRPKAGGIVTLVGDFTTPSFVQYAEVQGTSGTAFGSIQPQFSSFISTPGANVKNRPIHHRSDDITQALIADFIGAIAENRAPRCPVSDAVEVQRILERILEIRDEKMTT